ncbi:hypothetical protein VUR80DRAFT_4996 [Thermomyces stellatus]
MALALQPRLALLRAATSTTSTPIRAFTTSLPLARDDNPFPSRAPFQRDTAPAYRAPAAPLPNLPPAQKEVDPLAKEVRPQRVPHPYDANTSSIADIIGNTKAKSFSSPNFGPEELRVPVRTVPSTGRTVHVGGNVSVARAFQLIGQRCSANQIPAIANRQRFHERPGLRRKRLRMQRWRARFKNGFHHTVTRVQELARQGW